MLFRTILAPFSRAIAPRGWVVPLILGGIAAADYFTKRRQQGQYREEVDAAREARGDLFQAVGPRLAGLEGVDPRILRAAGRGLPPAPPQHSNLFQAALQIAGAYAQNRDKPVDAPTGDEPGALPTEPPGAGEAARMGGLTPGGDPAAQAADAAASQGAGVEEPARMGAMTPEQPPAAGTEEAAAEQTSAQRDFFNPIDVLMMA